MYSSGYSSPCSQPIYISRPIYENRSISPHSARDLASFIRIESRSVFFSSSLEILTQSAERISYNSTVSYQSLSISYSSLPSYSGLSNLDARIRQNNITSNTMNYNTNNYSHPLNHSNIAYSIPPTSTNFIHDPSPFLIENRPSTPIIENIDASLKKSIGHIFKLTTGNEMPEDILMSILDENKLKQVHSKHSKYWSNGIQGFAINRKHLNDFSSIFIKKSNLDSLLLTIGHEIGHCLSYSNNDIVLEEAKAFAFEIAWMKTIHKFDILGLSKNMNINSLNPANNGVHNVALSLVLEKLRDSDAIDIFNELSKAS